jgi:polysaccharide biosynthesis/export protein
LPGCNDPRIDLDEFVAMQNPPPMDDSEATDGETPAPHPLDVAMGEYRVATSDVLEVALTGLETPTGTNVYQVRVDSGGTVDLPMVGPVSVAGLDASGVERAIKTAYVPDIIRQIVVNVTVVEFNATNVLVTGAVIEPGLIPLRQTQRDVLHAVLAAGGFASSSSGIVTLKRVRGHGHKTSFNLYNPDELRTALDESPLEDGDMILVGAAQPNTVFIGGLVNRPAPQTYPFGVEMNVLQVLASAGGLREDVYPLEGTLIRRMPDGKDVRVKLNFPKIKNGEHENIVLAAGDILWVPETVGTKVLDFFNRNLFIRGGVTITYNANGLEYLNSNAQQQSLRTSDLQDQFDPFGFLNQNTALNNLQALRKAR